MTAAQAATLETAAEHQGSGIPGVAAHIFEQIGFPCANTLEAKL